MCVIIVKQNRKKRIAKTTLIASAEVNPHGLGILWLDTWTIDRMDSTDWEKLYTKRPFIAHFRYATVGKVSIENTHPFYIDGHNVLFQNGTVANMGCSNRTDAEQMAEILSDTRRTHWRPILESYDCRWITADLKARKYQIYNRKRWTKRNGILYSKANVLDKHLVAVYGTLKQGHSNHYRYLNRADYIGEARTVEPYRLIKDGLPYLLPYNGKGKQVRVEMYLVGDSTLKQIDGLEGHPTWYKRERVQVQNEDGQTYQPWIYLNDPPDNGQYIEEYEAPTRRNTRQTTIFDHKPYRTKYADTWNSWGYREEYGNGTGTAIWDDGWNEIEPAQEERPPIESCPICASTDLMDDPNTIDGTPDTYCFDCQEYVGQFMDQ